MHLVSINYSTKRLTNTLERHAYCLAYMRLGYVVHAGMNLLDTIVITQAATLGGLELPVIVVSLLILINQKLTSWFVMSPFHMFLDLLVVGFIQLIRKPVAIGSL
jgi:hypothetical protein